MTEATPFYARLAAGLLVADFLAWFAHFLQHRREDSVLWRMHGVHHSLDRLDMIEFWSPTGLGQAARMGRALTVAMSVGTAALVYLIDVFHLN